jgi:hypothetical protein
MARQKMRPDDIFFPAMALLILGIVLTGFAKTYFLAGMMFAKLPNRLVHVHGAVFVSWVSLLVAQTWLVAAHKTKWHRKLGVLALVLLPAMSILGTLTVIDFVRRALDYETPELILAGDLETLALFVLLTSWALLSRYEASAHKRLMILGTMAIMGRPLIVGTLELRSLSALFLVCLFLSSPMTSGCLSVFIALRPSPPR